MFIRVIKKFNNLELKRIVEVGEILEISPERFKELKSRENELGSIFVEEVTLVDDLEDKTSEDNGEADSKKNEEPQMEKIKSKKSTSKK